MVEIDHSALDELSKKTGWNLLNPYGNRNNQFCPQIVYGTREDRRNFCCLWWSDMDTTFKLCCVVNGLHVYNDRKLKFKKLNTYVNWCKKAEKKIIERKNRDKLKKIEKDF